MFRPLPIPVSRAVIVCCIIIAVLFVFARIKPGVLDVSKTLDRRVTSVCKSAGLRDGDVAREYTEERVLKRRHYIHLYREYDVPRSFALKKFGDALKANLETTRLRVTRADQRFAKGYDSAFFTIDFGAYEVMTLKMVRHGAQAKTLPQPVARKHDHPKVAIIIDDFGYNMNNLEKIVAIGQPVTFSILPNLPYSKRIAKEAVAAGYETILHLPLESQRKDVKEEFDTIRGGMTKEEIRKDLAAAVASVPGLSGISNHMGSKSTEDAGLMAEIFSFMKEKKLFFLDSLVTQKSVCRSVAQDAGIRYVRRDIFLDNSMKPDDIRAQIAALEKYAFTYGHAIALCHDRKATIAVLAEMMPILESNGIDFVRVSDMAQ